MAEIRIQKTVSDYTCQLKAEAEEKWGRTEAYKEYEEKTADYSEGKRNDAAEGIDRIMAELAFCMKNGKAPDSDEAQGLVKKLQCHISENFYNCTKEILSGLGQMYVADERFRSSIDKHSVGTASFISEAIEVYCK